MSKRDTLWRAVFSLGMVFASGAGAASCAPRGGNAARPQVAPADPRAAQLYLEAGRNFQTLELSSACGDTYAKKLAESVIKPLRMSRTNDPANPLFVTKLGEMLLKLPGQTAAGEAILIEALAVSQEWPPAWIDLAQIALDRGDIAAAERNLKSAQQALDSLKDRYKNPDSAQTPISFFGVTLWKPRGKNVNDPALSRDEQTQQLVVWLQADHAFSIDGATLLSEWGQQERQVTPDAMFRVTRARIALARVQIAKLRKQSTAEVGAAYREVYKWEPGYLPAKSDQSAFEAGLGNFQEAYDLLSWVTLPDTAPVVQGNPKIHLYMAQLCLDWYENPRGLDDQQRASIQQHVDSHLATLASIDKTNPEMLLLLARFNIDQAEVYKRSDLLQFAANALEQAAKSDCTPPARVNPLKRRLESVRQKLIAKT